jgi:hypothetical protein
VKIKKFVGPMVSEIMKQNIGKVQSVPEYTKFSHAFFAPSHSDCS